jgi:membrane protein DedA with SNARE-associated domain
MRTNNIMLAMLAGLFGITYASVSALIGEYGYIAIFVLTVLEAAVSLPSEVILPLVGYFGATGQINVYAGFGIAILGSTIGMIIDYYAAYFLGKEVVYRHLHLFHIKRKSLETFEAWFKKNGRFTVFISRLIPLVRALINFPAGFAEMPIVDFVLYSVAGSIIWSAMLVGFGYYAHGLVRNLYYLMVALALFFVALYALYRIMVKRILRELKKA